MRRRMRLQRGTPVNHAPGTIGGLDLALQVPALSGLPGAIRPQNVPRRCFGHAEIRRLLLLRTLFQLRSAFNPFLAGDAMRSPRNSFQPLQINIFSANETLAERAVFDSSQRLLYPGQ
jgi:hypothetical protein